MFHTHGVLSQNKSVTSWCSVDRYELKNITSILTIDFGRRVHAKIILKSTEQVPNNNKRQFQPRFADQGRPLVTNDKPTIFFFIFHTFPEQRSRPTETTRSPTVHGQSTDRVANHERYALRETTAAALTCRLLSISSVDAAVHRLSSLSVAVVSGGYQPWRTTPPPRHRRRTITMAENRCFVFIQIGVLRFACIYEMIHATGHGIVINHTHGFVVRFGFVFYWHSHLH